MSKCKLSYKLAEIYKEYISFDLIITEDTQNILKIYSVLLIGV